MANANAETKLPDWWQREKQRRLNYVLIFLVLLLLLIAYYYVESINGKIGLTNGVNFDTSHYIVFVREEQDPSKQLNLQLYAVRDDGTGLRRLTDANDKSNKFAPTWTLDGKSVVYVSDNNKNRSRQLYVLGDGDPKQLTYGTETKDAPVASPDGHHIAFVTQGAIKTVNINGNEYYQELPPPRSGNSEGTENGTNPGEAELEGPFLSAAFSGDGRGIAGVQAPSADNAILGSQMSANFGDQVARVVPPGGTRALILDTGHEVSLSWDPNNPRLACSFTELEIKQEGKPMLVSGIDVWNFENPAQPKRQPIFSCLGFSLEPKNVAWSPDGKKMAFEGWRLKGEGDRELRGILVLQVTGAAARVTPEDVDQLGYMLPTTAAGKPHNPRWSPDGVHILYELQRPDGGNDLCVINTDGTNPINLTQGKGGNNTQGAWSPARPK